MEGRWFPFWPKFTYRTHCPLKIRMWSRTRGTSLQWLRDKRDDVSNHQPHDCLLNHQSSALLAFVWGIHRGPVNYPHKGSVTRKIFPFDDVIMDRWLKQPDEITQPVTRLQYSSRTTYKDSFCSCCINNPVNKGDEIILLHDHNRQKHLGTLDTFLWKCGCYNGLNKNEWIQTIETNNCTLPVMREYRCKAHSQNHTWKRRSHVKENEMLVMSTGNIYWPQMTCLYIIKSSYNITRHCREHRSIELPIIDQISNLQKSFFAS